MDPLSRDALNSNDQSDGFASSSSDDDEQTVKIIQRKRTRSQLQTLANMTIATLATSPVNHDYPGQDTSLFERLLWLLTFVWTSWHASKSLSAFGINTFIGTWNVILLSGLVLCRLASRSSLKRVACANELSSSTLSSEDYHSSSDVHQGRERIYQKDPCLVPRNSAFKQPLDHPSYSVFGVGPHAFRSGADNGLWAGVLLLPMTALAKFVDAVHDDDKDTPLVYYQAKAELVFLMSLVCLVLVLTNPWLNRGGLTISKRRRLISSIIVSLAITTMVVLKSPLTPALSRQPLTLTLPAMACFPGALFICARALKRCFTLGEMCILSTSTAIVFHGSLEYIAAAHFPDHVGQYLLSDSHSPVSVLLHALVLGMLAIGLITFPLLRYSRRLAQKRFWRSSERLAHLQHHRIMIALAIYALTAAVVLFVIGPLCQSILGHNPFFWTLDFVFMSPGRLILCLYWSFAVAATVVVWVLVLDFSSPDQPSSSRDTKGKALTSTLNKKRKLFHALAVIMFVPGVLFDMPFLQLAFGVALAAFIYLEYIRFFAVWPYGKNIHMFLSEFIDSRDLGPVILSHIYLLLGCAGPVWLSSSNLFANLAGILALGVGDTAASLAGKRFGRWHWRGTNKTVEGTITFVLAVNICAILITYTTALIGAESSVRHIALTGQEDWTYYGIVVILTGLLEALSRQNDNIIIPLYMYTLLALGHQ